MDKYRGLGLTLLVISLFLLMSISTCSKNVENTKQLSKSDSVVVQVSNDIFADEPEPVVVTNSLVIDQVNNMLAEEDKVKVPEVISIEPEPVKVVEKITLPPYVEGQAPICIGGFCYPPTTVADVQRDIIQPTVRNYGVAAPVGSYCVNGVCYPPQQQAQPQYYTQGGQTYYYYPQNNNNNRRRTGPIRKFLGW